MNVIKNIVNMNLNRSYNGSRPTDHVMKGRDIFIGHIPTIEGLNKKILPTFYNQPYNIEPAIANSMTDNQLLEKSQRLTNALNDGAVFTLDLETLGSFEKIQGMSDELQKMNDNLFTLTEIALVPKRYKGGKQVDFDKGDEIERYFSEAQNITTTRSYAEMLAYKQKVTNMEGMTSLDVSNLRRMSGYGIDGAFNANGTAVAWGETEDFTTSGAVERGIEQLSTIKNGQTGKLRVGSSAYKDYMSELKGRLLNISSMDGYVIATANGENFDMPALFEGFRRAGVGITDDEINQIMGSHVDFQKLAIQSSSSDILNLQTQAGSSSTSMTNSNMVIAANQHAANSGVHSNIKLTDAHVAYADADATGEVISTLQPLIQSNVDKINAARTAAGQVNRIYMNNTFKAGDNDTFAVSGFGRTGTYNPNILQSGMTYDVDYFETPMYYKPGVFMAKFTQVGGDGHVVHMLTTQDRMQEQLFNSGAASFSTIGDRNVDRQNALAITDKTSDTIRSFFRTGYSGGGYSSFRKYMSAYESIMNLDIKPENIGEFLSNQSNLELLKPSLSNKRGQISREQLGKFKSVYQELKNNYKYYSALDEAVQLSVSPDSINAKSSYFNETLDHARTIALSVAERTITNEANSHLNNIPIPTSLVSDLHKMERYRGRLDIAGIDGGYVNINASNTAALRKSLGITVRRNKANNKIKGSNDLIQMSYMDNIVKDLNQRGLISDGDFKSISGATTVNSRLSLLTSSIMSGRETAFKGSNSAINEYVNRANITPVISANQRINSQAKMNSRYIELKGGHDFMERVVSSVRRNIPGLVSADRTLTSTGFAGIQDHLSSLGWSSDNIDTFTEGVLKSPHLATFNRMTGANAGEVIGGMSYLTMSDGEKDWMAITSADRINGLTDSINSGKTVEELQDQAMFIRLPKVADVNGTRVMKYSDSYEGIITKDIKFNRADGTYSVKDTMDEYVEKLGSRLYYAKEKAEAGNYLAANQTMKMGMGKLYEDKSRVAVSTRTTNEGNGKYGITKQLGWNAADASNGNIIDTSELIYSLPAALSDRDGGLYKGFAESMGGAKRADDYLSEINRQVSEGIDYKNKKDFASLGTAGQLWFQSNISEIAQNIASNADVANSSESFLSTMSTIASVGSKGFIVKETDSVRGMFNLKANDYYVAGARLTNASRPTLQQKMAGVNVYVNDISNNVNKMFGSSVSIGMGDVGMLPGSSWATEGFVADVQNKLNDGQLAEFSVKTKMMSSGNLVKSLNKMQDISEGSSDYLAIAKIISKNNPNIRINARTIKKLATRMSLSGTNYEDSAMISPMLAASLNPQAITTKNASTDKINFQVGQVLKNGDIISYDKSGNAIRHKSRDAIITDVGDGKLTIQQFGNYNSQKLIAGAEKAEYTAPVVDNYDEAVIADAMIKQMSGGASIISNPNLGKHEASNTILSAYTNAIGNSITNDDEMGKVNAILAKNIESQSFQYQKNRYGRYQLIEGSRTGGSEPTLSKFKDTFNELIGGVGGSFQQNYLSALSDLSNDVGYIDYVKGQDNTIVNAQGHRQENVGASTSPRSQSVMGAFIGSQDDALNQYYRYNEEGGVESIWEPLIMDDMKTMMEDEQFVSGLRQGKNLKGALASNNQFGLERLGLGDFNYADININDALFGGGRLPAEMMPQIFKTQLSDGTRVNGYRINLNGIELDNYLVRKYQNDGHNLSVARQILKNKKIGFGNVKEVFIPAMEANGMDGEFTLTDSQRKVNDFIRNYHKVVNPQPGSESITTLRENLQNSYDSMIESFAYELTDKNGILKNSMKSKLLFSQRAKINSIATPVLNSDGTFMDTVAQKYSNKAAQYVGDGGYSGFMVQSPTDFFSGSSDIKSEYARFGQELIRSGFDKSDESVQMIKKYLGRVNGVSGANDFDTVQRILSGKLRNRPLRKAYEALGRDYLRTIGVDSHIVRDPAQLGSSHNIARLFITEDIQTGTIYTDPVTGKYMNADSDGDEVNIIKRIFKKDGSGNWTLRSSGDSVLTAMNEIKNKTANQGRYELELMAGDVASKESGLIGLDYDKYVDFIKETNPELFNNTDSFDSGMRNALLSKLTKGTIGQVSNPNLYMRAASQAYFKNRPNSEINSIMRRNLINIQNHFEQKLIDVKTMKSQAEANAFLEVAGNFRTQMNKLSSSNKNDVEKAATFMYNTIANTYGLYSEDVKDGLNVSLGYKYRGGEAQSNIVAQAVRRAMEGKAIRFNASNEDGSAIKGVSTVEEILQDMLTVLQDPEGKKAFWAANTRQTNVVSMNGQKIDPSVVLERILDTGEQISSGNGLFDLMYNANLDSDNLVVNGQAFTNGDYISSVSGNDSLGAGLYDIRSIRPNADGGVDLVLKTGKREVVLSGNNMTDVSNKLNGFIGIDRGSAPDIKSLKRTMKAAVKMNRADMISQINSEADSLVDSGQLDLNNRESFVSDTISQINRGIKHKGQIKQYMSNSINGTSSTSTVWNINSWRNSFNEKVNNIMGSKTFDSFSAEQRAQFKDGYIKEIDNLVSSGGNSAEDIGNQFLSMDRDRIAEELVRQMNTNTKIDAETLLNNIATDVANQVGFGTSQMFSNEQQNAIMGTAALIGGAIWMANNLGRKKMMGGPRSQYKESAQSSRSYNRHGGGVPSSQSYGGYGAGPTISVSASHRGISGASRWQGQAMASVGMTGANVNVNHSDSRRPIMSSDIDNYFKNNI